MKDLLDGVLNTARIRPVSGATQDIMRCPRCNARIPEGMLYCEVCGEEIHFVPEFEPEVDDSIAVAMNGVASEIASENGMAAKSAGGFVRREDLPDDAWFDFHVRFPKRTLRYMGFVLGAVAVVSLAVIAIPRILRLQVFDRASRAREEEAALVVGTPTEEAEVLLQDGEEAAAQETVQTPDAPELDHSSGRYQGELVVTLVNRAAGCAYYYTLDGTAPSATSERYLSPIVVAEGETTLRMIAVGADGETSGETIAVYTVEPAIPQTPVILEDSGEYTQSTMIVVVSQENATITYTTDGSDPEIDSAVYTAPIKMPVGSSVFRFRAFDEEGNGSEIAERFYHLVYARLVSEEQAVASVVRVLVDKNVLIDGTGKVLGAEGYNVYLVESVIEIEGAGEYYRIVERYVAPDGSAADTGLFYAVNTNDGSVHRLGYDSSGRYTLFTLAGH